MAKSDIALLIGKAKPGGSSESPGPSGSGALDAKAAALKSMWRNMKSGDFEAAAMDFQDAYMECKGATEYEEEDEEGAEEDMMMG